MNADVHEDEGDKVVEAFGLEREWRGIHGFQSEISYFKEA